MVELRTELISCVGRESSTTKSCELVVVKPTPFTTLRYSVKLPLEGNEPMMPVVWVKGEQTADEMQ